MNRKGWILIVLAVCVVAAGLVLYYWHGKTTGPANVTEQNLPVAQINSQTAEQNSTFAEAVQSESHGQYAAAITQLQEALYSTSDPTQTNAILSHLQQDYELVGDYSDAVRTLQQIAGTSAYPQVSRAFAVEELGLLYVRYPDASSTLQIFSESPYRDLYVATSTNLTTRHLFSYATTIYPLPISEYYIAQSYANVMLNQKVLGQSSSTAEIVSATLKQKLVSSFQDGNAALEAVSQHPPTAIYILNAKLMNAIVLESLQRLGDTSLGDAGQAFQALLTAYDSQDPADDGSVRLQYAYYLMNIYGTSRASDIRSILEPISRSPSHGGIVTVNVLKGYIGTPVSPAKTAVVVLSTLDPDFKAFLVSLGWTSADFASSTAAAK
jgi:hypothetical protein